MHLCMQDTGAGSLGASGLRHCLLLSGGAWQTALWRDCSHPLGVRGCWSGCHRHSTEQEMQSLHHSRLVFDIHFTHCHSDDSSDVISYLLVYFIWKLLRCSLLSHNFDIVSNNCMIMVNGISSKLYKPFCVVSLGSTEKRAYLQERFPQLSAESFANSRDASFEQHILLHTQGKGQTPLSVLTNCVWHTVLHKFNIFSL